MKTRTLSSQRARPAPTSRIRTPRVSAKAFAQLLRTPTARAKKRETKPGAPETAQPLRREPIRPRAEPEPERRPRLEPEPRERAPEPLEAFSPLPSIVATGPSAEPTAVGASWDRAQVAAMAERMLSSFRRSDVDGEDEVRMQLRVLDAEVRVRLDEGRVVATLVGEGLEGLASTLERELRARGLESEITLAPD